MKFPLDWRRYTSVLKPYLQSENGHLKYIFPARLCRDPRQRITIFPSSPSDTRAIRNKVSELKRMLIPGALEDLMGYRQPKIGTNLGEKLVEALHLEPNVQSQHEETIEFEETGVVVTGEMILIGQEAPKLAIIPVPPPAPTRMVLDLDEIKRSVHLIQHQIIETQDALINWDKRKQELQQQLEQQQTSLKQWTATQEAAELFLAVAPQMPVARPEATPPSQLPATTQQITQPTRILDLAGPLFSMNKEQAFTPTQVYAWLRQQGHPVRDSKAVNQALAYAVKQESHHVQRVEDGYYSYI